MKNTFKLSLSLLANQFLASIGGFMCVIFVFLLARDSIYAHIIFMIFTYPFFIYIEYRSAFNYGFHDPDRRNKPKSKKYLYKGAISGFISGIPLIALIVLYIFSSNAGNLFWSETAKLYTRIIAMYYNWPMCNMFPNHTLEVFLTSLIGIIIFPMIGYIAGYKNFVISDKIYCMLKIKPMK